MEIIVVILILVFVFANANDKSKKKQAAAKGRTRQAKRGQRPPRENDSSQSPVSSIPKENFESALAELQEKLSVGVIPDGAVRRVAEPVARAVGGLVSQGASMLADDECAGGSMAHTHDEGHSHLDDEDCAGGSMAHTHSEGVSRADHARRMAAIDAYSAGGDVLPEAIDVQALRRAVVMAEVLGKPRALRKT